MCQSAGDEQPVGARVRRLDPPTAVCRVPQVTVRAFDQISDGQTFRAHMEMYLLNRRRTSGNCDENQANSAKCSRTASFRSSPGCVPYVGVLIRIRDVCSTMARR